jgi:hypothetical protein
MPRKKPDPPPVDLIENDFLLAIERLELRTPREHVLQMTAGRINLALTSPPSRWRLATAAPKSTTTRV